MEVHIEMDRENHHRHQTWHKVLLLHAWCTVSKSAVGIKKKFYYRHRCSSVGNDQRSQIERRERTHWQKIIFGNSCRFWSNELYYIAGKVSDHFNFTFLQRKTDVLAPKIDCWTSRPCGIGRRGVVENIWFLGALTTRTFLKVSSGMRKKIEGAGRAAVRGKLEKVIASRI